MSLLQGPVVFIDDQVHDESAAAYQLARQIRETGRPLAEYEALPPKGHVEHWRSIAFLVLDWDLVPGSPGTMGGSTLSEFARASLFEWLESFVGLIFCPIFIVSAEDVDDIQRQLAENDALQKVVDTGRLKVFAKQTIMTNFIDYLEGWVSSTPALAALNIWANEHEAATDRLFFDMENLASDWPAYVWQTALADHIDPSFELASVLSANLLHRLDVLRFDVDAISDMPSDFTASSMRLVSRGRTTLLGERLHDTMVLPGDLFSDPEDGGSVWLNVTPACHTVLNRPSGPDQQIDPNSVSMHLIRGQRLDLPTSKSSFGKLKQAYDGPNGMLVHTLLGHEPYAFQFKERRLASWGEVGALRIARLLPPYITLLQQRHAAFLMNEGLPRTGWELYDG